MGLRTMKTFSKAECPECLELDKKLRAFLKDVPPDPQEEPVKDPTPYMCSVHGGLYRSRMSGKLIPMPLDFVLGKMVLKSNEHGVPNYEAEFPSLEGKDVQVRRKKDARDTYEVSVDGQSFLSVTDVNLEDGTYVFHEPWIVTEGFWNEEGNHQVPSDTQVVYARYHAFPVTYDEDAEAGKVQVYCEKPHLTPEGKPCRARLTDAEEHHVVCPTCGVEIKLWEYAVGPEQHEHA